METNRVMQDAVNAKIKNMSEAQKELVLFGFLMDHLEGLHEVDRAFKVNEWLRPTDLEIDWTNH